MALDALEHDAYWAVFEKIDKCSSDDIEALSEALEQFGLLELSTIGVQAANRLRFLDYLDKIASNANAHEKEMHKSIENNLWVLGRKYASMSSNATLGKIIETYCGMRLRVPVQKSGQTFCCHKTMVNILLLEFKRPSHDITRGDIVRQRSIATICHRNYLRRRGWIL